MHALFWTKLLWFEMKGKKKTIKLKHDVQFMFLGLIVLRLIIINEDITVLEQALVGNG